MTPMKTCGSCGFGPPYGFQDPDSSYCTCCGERFVMDPSGLKHGQRVRLSGVAESRGVSLRGTREGTFVRYTSDGRLVVRPDGYASESYWHPSYWVDAAATLASPDGAGGEQ